MDFLSIFKTLSENKIAYSDFHGGNVLCEDGYNSSVIRLRLIDFGQAKLHRSEKEAFDDMFGENGNRKFQKMLQSFIDHGKRTYRNREIFAWIAKNQANHKPCCVIL